MAETKIGIIIEAEDRATNVLKGIERNLNGMQGKLRSMQPTFKRMAVAGTIAFGAVSVGIKKTINVARDFEEETNKFNVVFKDVGDKAREMAKTLNESYGLSRLESKRLLASTGDILTGFGFTGEGALDLASKVNTLSVDLASFTNAQGGAEAVSNALTKALLGERESLKTYGIAIQEADIKAELLKRGMEDLTGEALRQAKAQITLEIAFRQSKNAVGDYARSTGTLKQSQVELQKTMEDLSISIGTTLAPILNDVIKKITPVIKKVLEWVEANPELTKKIILWGTALIGVVAVLGTIGLILPSVITGITLMGKAFAVANSSGVLVLGKGLSSLTFAGALGSIAIVVAALAGLIAILDKTVQAYQNLKNEMGLLASTVERGDKLQEKALKRIKELEDAGDKVGAQRIREKSLGLTEATSLAVSEALPKSAFSQIGGADPLGVTTPAVINNFDFRNAVVADKETFIKDIEFSMSRSLELQIQGI